MSVRVVLIHPVQIQNILFLKCINIKKIILTTKDMKVNKKNVQFFKERRNAVYCYSPIIFVISSICVVTHLQRSLHLVISCFCTVASQLH